MRFLYRVKSLYKKKQIETNGFNTLVILIEKNELPLGAGRIFVRDNQGALLGARLGLVQHRVVFVRDNQGPVLGASLALGQPRVVLDELLLCSQGQVAGNPAVLAREAVVELIDHGGDEHESVGLRHDCLLLSRRMENMMRAVLIYDAYLIT